MITEPGKWGARLAILLSLAIVGVSASRGGPRSAITAVAMVLLPLVCVLFPAAMGSVKGIGYITRTSEQSGVAVLGWALLFALALLTLVAAFSS